MKKLPLILLYYYLLTSSIYSQWTDAYIPDFKVNDDNLNSYQAGSFIGVDSAGDFIVAWTDSRINPGSQYPYQVYLQRYNKNGVPLGNNFRIGHDTAGLSGISLIRDGRFVVTWVRFFVSPQKYEFYYQRFNKNGISLGPPNRVLDSSFNVEVNVYLQGTSISSDSSGRFVICWSKGHTFNSSPLVYFQRYDSSGNRLGVIDSLRGTGRAEFPDIQMNNDGSFIIVWKDDRANPLTAYDIYMQRFDNNGNRIGSEIKVNDDNNPLFDQGGARISTDGNGFTVVCWIDNRNNQSNIFYQLYDTNGSALDINRQANIYSTFGFLGRPSITMRKDRRFFIGWLDANYSGRDQFYGRRFDSFGNFIGVPYMIPMSSPGNSNQGPGVKAVYLLGDRVYSTWVDNRNGGQNNWDIYCNVRGFQNPDTTIGIIELSETVKEFILFPAYPNPFNSSTKLKFQVVKPDIVVIKVFDIIGHQLEVLISQKLNAGTYEIEWHAEYFSSGIYFAELRTESGYRKVQKLILSK